MRVKVQGWVQWWRAQSFSHFPQQHLWSALCTPVSPSLQQPDLLRACVTSGGQLHAVTWQNNHRGNVILLLVPLLRLKPDCSYDKDKISLKCSFLEILKHFGLE